MTMIWNVVVVVHKNGGFEQKTYTVCASSTIKACQKIKDFLRSKNCGKYELVSVHAANISESHLKRKELRAIERYELRKKRRTALYYEKKRVKKPRQWVKLNYDLLYDLTNAA